MTILDKDGVPLSPEEEIEYSDDLFTQVPMGRARTKWMWEKWGERLGIQNPFPDGAADASDDDEDRRTLPERLYLERWPMEARRNDSIFYEQTGYGDDGEGHTSEITVYVNEEHHRKLLRLCLDTLRWCAGADDFQDGGKAAVGWATGVRPVLKALEEELEAK